MKKKVVWQLVIVLCALDMYIVSFFFVFNKVSVMTEIVANEKQERTGPKGISIVAPRGPKALNNTLFVFYYPLHTTLKIKYWVYPIISTEILWDDEWEVNS